MIIKGTSRAGPNALAAHLGNAEKNERVQLIETRGTVAEDLRGALIEMDALASGTRCQKSLYHAALSPEPPHRLSENQRIEAIDALETKLGLDGHARVIVLHEKEGREHLHVVWTRIDIERMRSVSDSHNYRRHEEVARDLERRFGHDRVQGAHVEREGVERPDRTPSRSELRQEERTGIKCKDVKVEVTAAFQASDGAEAFRAALADRGYVLAQGDRRDFVIVDYAGGIHSLARRLDGVKAAGLREFMAPIDAETIPTISEVKSLMREQSPRDVGRQLAEDEHALRRLREADEAFDAGDAYGRGGGYVRQTKAARADFDRRQKSLNEGPDTSADPEISAEKLAAAQERLRRVDAARREAEDAKRDRDGPDPLRGQSGAPGGGHTRSR